MAADHEPLESSVPRCDECRRRLVIVDFAYAPEPGKPDVLQVWVCPTFRCVGFKTTWAAAVILSPWERRRDD